MRRVWALLLVLGLALAQAGNDTWHHLEHGGLKRDYLLHLPSGYDPTLSYPLVMVIHGAASSPERMAEVTGFSKIADREKFIVVYPAGTVPLVNNDSVRRSSRARAWNTGVCCALGPNPPDDVGFLKDLLHQLKSDLPVDPNRVYVTGFSLGGIMTHRLGAELSSELAAIAPLAGTIGGGFSGSEPHFIPEPASPLPVMIFHGMEDSLVPYYGGNLAGTGLHIASASDSARFWARANGCREENHQVINEYALLTSFTGCTENSEVRLYSLPGSDHVWPGGKAFRLPPFPYIAASERIWMFFESHSKIGA